MARPLFWHQGLFLQPQHFQLEDIYNQSLLTPFHRLLQPHFWGVGDLEVQTSGLGNFSFNLLKIEALFPDMTYVVFADNALLQARSFDDGWVDGGKPLTVYIGLKKWNQAGENVTVVSSLDNIQDVTTRFVTTADPEDVIDFHQGGASAQVKKLHYLLKIFWETEVDQLGDYVLIPVARIEKSGDEIILAPQFIPPALTITASDTLLKIIVEVKDQIASRARQLESYKRERGIHTAEFGARDMVYLLALRSLSRYVPVLAQLTETDVVHPWTVYGILRQVIGELSSFSEQVSLMGELGNGPNLDLRYDHRNLGKCFANAGTIITRLLDEITAGPEYVIQLLYDGTYYTAELPPAIFEGSNRFYLVFTTKSDSQFMLDSLESIAKLGSRETLPLLIARALPGVKLDYLKIPPQELPRRADSCYLQIDHHSNQWARIEQGNNLALYWDSAPEDLSIELMITGR